MNTAINLGECLYGLIALFVVCCGLWRAWMPRTAAIVRKLIAAIPVLDMSSLVARFRPADGTPGPIPGIGIGTDTPLSDDEPIPAEEPVLLSRHMNDVDIIVLLAAQKKGDKYRFSANKIYALTGGNHDDVLGIIRQIQGKDKLSGKGITSDT